MRASRLSRRKLLSLGALAVAGAAVASCGATPTTVQPTKAPAATAVRVATAEAEATSPAATATAVPTEVPVATVAPAATAVPATKGATELNFWVCWGGIAVQTMQKLADSEEFAAFSPDTKVTVVEGKWTDAILPAIAAGEGFDAAACETYNELIARGAMLPLTEQINASSNIPKDEYFDEAWIPITYKGERYGVPAIEGWFRLALCYSKDMFKAEGLDPEKPPTTWEEVLELHRKLTKFDDAGNVTQIGLDPYDGQGGWVDSNSPWVMPVTWGFEWFDPDTLKYMIDQPDMVEGWKNQTEFYTIAGPEKMGSFRQAFGGWTDPNGSFAKNLQAMQINGYWTPGELVNNAPDKKFGYSWLPVPAKVGAKKVHGVGTHAVIIPTISKDREKAFKWAEFCISDTFCDAMFQAVGWLPPRTKYVQGVDAASKPGLEFFISTATDPDVTFAGCTFNPVESQTLDIWTKLRQEVYFDRITSEEGVSQMQEQCTAALEEMMAG